VITVVGEILIDLVGEGTGAQRFAAFPGGSPANVAVTLARLGVDTSLLARISRDRFGQRLRAHLADNRVSARDLVEAAEPTTLAVAILDAAANATYDFYIEGTADWQWTARELPDPLADDVVALHAGSLALALPPGASALEQLLVREYARERVTIMFDPNIRAALARSRNLERERVERIMRSAHIVKASAEDLDWLYPGEPVENVVERWIVLGPQLVVVTRGDQGSYAATASGTRLAVPVTPIGEVADTVGAGDAFSGGLLDALLSRDLLGAARHAMLGNLDAARLREVLAHAGLVAALTCGRRGADPPDRATVLAAQS
jgi:fructokinase